MDLCKARLTRGKKEDGLWVLAFKRKPGQEKSKLFFAPFRCNRTCSGDLCGDCIGRMKRTNAYVLKCDGKYVANQDSLLHGLVGEEPPVWSHVYKGKWFCEFSKKNGMELDEAVERRAEEAFATAVADSLKGSGDTPVDMARAKKNVEPICPAEEPVAEPTAEPPKKFRAKKGVTAEAPVAAAPVPVAAAPKAVRKPKQVTQKPSTLLGVINPAPLHDIEVVKIAVKKFEIDGRTIYLSTKKDKVYDLKFNYLGRYNRADECIETKYPDSDRE
jgi:hypothetical protein